MAEQRQERENCGALFINDRKQKDTHPDLQGNLSVTINGVVHKLWLKGWYKKAKESGVEFTSLACELNTEGQQQGNQQQRPAQQGQGNQQRRQYPS